MWQTYAMQTWQTCKTCYVSCKMCLWIPLSLGNRVASNLSKAFYLLTVHQPIALATFLSSESNSRSEREPKEHRMQLPRVRVKSDQNAPQSTTSYAMAPLPPLDACHKGDSFRLQVVPWKRRAAKTPCQNASLVASCIELLGKRYAHHPCIFVGQ